MQVDLPEDDFEILHKDVVGKFYTVNGNDLQQLDEKLKIRNEFRHEDYQVISGLDVTDPHKIALFYEDDQAIVILDEQLAPIAELQFEQLENVQLRAMLRSNDGNFWFFNSNEQTLIKLSEEGKVMDESFPLYQEGLVSFDPVYAMRGSTKMCFSDPDNGVVIYDHLGNFKRFLPLTGVRLIQMNEEKIFYLKNDALFMYNIRLFEERKIYEFEAIKTKALYIDMEEGVILSVSGNYDEIEKIKTNNR